MSASASAFADSNCLLYLLSGSQDKAARVRAILLDEVIVSVQVLNEITNVARKKFGLSWSAIDEFLNAVQAVCQVIPLTAQTNALARKIAEQYDVSFYDAGIVASALLNSANILYSEDLQHGMRFEKTLRVVNPFRAP
jgi:predicted nucleic acid-binding protein